MEIYYKRKRHLSSLFTRFIIGFTSGFVGMLVLSIILFLSLGILENFLVTSNEIDSLGNIINQIETNTLSLIIFILAIFISTLVMNLSYAFLSLLVEEHYTKKATTLTHVFYGNVIFLLCILPLYILVNKYYNTEGIKYIAALHIFITSFFSIFVLQSIHQVKYVLVNLYGNILGLLIFIFTSILVFGSSDQFSALAFLILPLFMGIMAFSNRFIELFYAFLYTQMGIDMLNIETTFGDDYGVPLTEKSFNEVEEFEKEFKI